MFLHYFKNHFNLLVFTKEVFMLVKLLPVVLTLGQEFRLGLPANTTTNVTVCRSSVKPHRVCPPL